MKVTREEHGITLVEVLATLVILSIVGIGMWSAFFQGFEYSNKTISENLMIQEANILITNLTKIHQKTEEYEIENDGCKIVVTINGKPQTFKHDRLCYRTDFTKETIKPKEYGGDLQFKVTIYEEINPKNEVSVDSILYRVKGGVNYE